MRIISQDGTIDIPYNLFSLSVASGKYKDVEYSCIYCHNISAPHGTKMAEYSSKEKAIKAMEMLRNEYGKHYLGQGGAMATANFYVPAFGFIPPKVFQFPKNDEVEV